MGGWGTDIQNANVSTNATNMAAVESVTTA